jgi:hypothetical protein
MSDICEDDFYTLLKTITDLPCYPESNEDDVYPCVTWSVVSDQDGARGIGGTSQQYITRIQIDVISKKHIEAITNANLIKKALSGYRGRVGATYFVIRHEQGYTRKEVNNNEWLYCKSNDYFVKWSTVPQLDFTKEFSSEFE